MSADSKNVPDTFADQLASFDDKLHATANNVDLLTDVQAGISELLAASGNSEAQIRKVLQEQYESGSLRKETFQLVKSMLDRYVTENIPTSANTESIAPSKIPEPANETPVQAPQPSAPLPLRDASETDDQFGTTTIIPIDFAIDKSAGSRVQVGSLLRDRFLLQEQISGGSMGVVYKAMDRRLAEAGSDNHWVAIKVLSPEFAGNAQALRALQQEAAKGRCLVHPNIVQFIDLDRDDDLYFLIMEWLEGRTLADILDSRDASVIDAKAAFRITRDIGAALEYAHSRGIVHADIKPGNIMVMPNGEAKLFDFGVARVRQQHSDPEFDPGVLGAMTPAYSSMQVLGGEDPVAADDVFSLCCLLYRLIAGYRVFGPRNAAEASQEGMKPQRLKGVNDSQWRALKKGLSYARVTRFSSVKEFIEALDKHQDEPFRVEEPDRFEVIEDHASVGKWIVAFLLITGLGAFAAYQRGYLDPYIERFTAPVPEITSAITVQETDLASFGDEQPADEAALEAQVEEVVAAPVAESIEIAEEPVAEAEVPDLIAEMITEMIDETPMVGPDPMLVNFSSLPPATEIITFTPGRALSSPVNIAVREDGAPLIIDFVRGSGLSTPMTLRLEEVGYSGNRSPWGSGQYALSNSGMIHFPAGQSRGRVTLTMASDPLREADQQSTLRLREADLADSELATLNVRLEDDDQRAFEAGLPGNSIAFGAKQVSVRETAPAVQIDIVRFNPDSTSVTVEFTMSDLSATEGEDYFSPGERFIRFGPQQRSARLLVPLVQDVELEGDESFIVELVSSPQLSGNAADHQIVVTIRDDETQTP